MKATRIAALVLALAMVFALAGCGEAAEPIDVSALGQQLVDAAGFGEPMNALDGAVALGLYGAPEGTTVAAWAGTGATAEEVAVFDCGSAEAANGYFKQGFDSVTVSLDIAMLADATAEMVKKSLN